MHFTLRTRLIGMALAAIVFSVQPAAAQIANGPQFQVSPGDAYRNNLAFDPVNQVYLMIVQRPPVTGRFYNKNGVRIGADFQISNEPGYIAWVSIGFGGPANDPAFLVTYVQAEGANPKFGRLVRYGGGSPSVSPASWITDVTSEWIFQEKATNLWNGSQFIVGSRVVNPGASLPTYTVSHFHMNGAVSGPVDLGDGQDYYGSPAISCASNSVCLAVGYMAGVPTNFSGGSYARRFDAASLVPVGGQFALDSGAPNEDQGVVYRSHTGNFLTQWYRGGGAGYIHTRIVGTDGSMTPLDLNRGIGPQAGTNAAVYNAGTQTTLLLTKSSGAALLALELGDDGYPRNPNNVLLETAWDGTVLDYHPSISANVQDAQWMVSWTMQTSTQARIIYGNQSSGGGQPDPVQNGDFSAGMTNWQIFSIPSQAVAASVNGGILEFYRAPQTPQAGNQGVILQPLNVGLAANAPIAAEFDLGNSSTVRKRMTVLIHDANFSDLHVCTFWLEPFQPMERFAMRTHSQQPWSNATISFYAATEGSDGGAYRLDNVSVSFNPGQLVDRTDCVDPTVPPPGGGGDGPNLIANGNFSSALLSWQLFGQISASLGGGALRFVRPEGTPAGALLQPTGVGHGPNTRLTATFDLGNSSSVRKRVTAILHDQNFSDLAACTFWVNAGQALTPFTMRVFTKRAWGNATISFYLGSVDTNNWALVDNVTLRHTPAQSMHGTECISDTGVNGASALAAPASEGDVATGSANTAFTPQSAAPRVRTPIRFDPQDPAAGGVLSVDWMSAGSSAELDRAGRPVWRSTVSEGELNRLAGTTPVDLRQMSGARLTFSSWRSDDDGSAEVQVSIDGLSWVTISDVSSTSGGWDAIEVSLDDYAGQLVFVRLVHTSRSGSDTSTWWVTRLALHAR